MDWCVSCWQMTDIIRRFCHVFKTPPQFPRVRSVLTPALAQSQSQMELKLFSLCFICFSLPLSHLTSLLCLFSCERSSRTFADLVGHGLLFETLSQPFLDCIFHTEGILTGGSVSEKALNTSLSEESPEGVRVI